MNIRETVFSNLDSAKENGYFELGEQLHGSTPQDIALDMLVYAADCEAIDDEQVLIPHIEEWLKLNQLTLPVAQVTIPNDNTTPKTISG